MLKGAGFRAGVAIFVRLVALLGLTCGLRMEEREEFLTACRRAMFACVEFL